MNRNFERMLNKWKKESIHIVHDAKHKKHTKNEEIKSKQKQARKRRIQESRWNRGNNI